MTAHTKTAAPSVEVWVPNRKLSDRDLLDIKKNLHDFIYDQLEQNPLDLPKTDRHRLADALTEIARIEGELADSHGHRATVLYATARSLRK